MSASPLSEGSPFADASASMGNESAALQQQHQQEGEVGMPESWSSNSLLSLSARLPPPPPRPPSLESVSRRSSRTSSRAAFDDAGSGSGSVTGTPPLPTLSLADELAASEATPPLPSPTTSHASLHAPPPPRPQRRRASGSSRASMSSETTGGATTTTPARRRSKMGSRTSSMDGLSATAGGGGGGPTIIIRQAPVPPPPPPAPTPPLMSVMPSELHRTQAGPMGSLLVKSEATFLATTRDRISEFLYHNGAQFAVTFATEATSAFKAIIRDLWIPLAMAALSMLAPLLSLLPESMQPKMPKGPSEAAAIDRSAAAKRFTETWKHTLAASFLLTRTLNVASYADTASVLPSSTSGKARVARALRTLALRQPRRVPRRHPSLPPLTVHGRTLRDATAFALFALVFLSPTMQLWGRTAMAMVCATWAALLVHGTDAPPALTYTLSFRPAPGCDVLRRGLTGDEGTEEVKGLVSAARSFDGEVQKALSAVREVELVARGYKLSSPLPPISRIEAREAASFRPRNASWNAPSAGAPLGAKPMTLGRSSSTGGTWRRNQAGGGGSGASAPEEVRRMSALRRAISDALEGADEALRKTIETLAPLVDAQELALLREMYATESEAVAGAETLEDTSLGGSVSMMPRSAPPSGERSSWTMTSPASKRSSVLDPSVFAPHAAALASSGDEGTSTPSGYKRLSLLTETSSAPSSVTSTLGRRGGSKRESMSHEPQQQAQQQQPARPGSRLAYVSENPSGASSPTAASTPNESAALKRLSYASVGSSSAVWTPVGSRPSSVSLSAVTLETSPASSSAYKRAGSPGPAQGLSLSSEAAGAAATAGAGVAASRRISVNVQAALAATPLAQQDAQSLVGLKTAFEDMHTTRRRTLAHLLALDFSASRASAEPTYWPTVRAAVSTLRARFHALERSVRAALAHDMGKTSATAEASRKMDLLQPPNAVTQDHTGLEDRTSAMGNCLRAVQVKLRAATEEMLLLAPPSLHGSEDSHISAGGSAYEGEGSSSGNNNKAERAERVFESIREDLLALSAEWEAGLKILRSEIRRNATREDVPSPSPTPSDVGLRLDSPQEAEEDAIRAWALAKRSSGSSVDEPPAVAMKRWAAMALGASTDDEDSQDDVATMLRQGATLPPPGGLEQVYESTSGAPVQNATKQPKLTRDERIAYVRAQRAAAASEQNTARERAAHDERLVGPMVAELKGVLHGIKTKRTSMLSDSSSSERGLATLGSPLHLNGSRGADNVGTFEPLARAALPDVRTKRSDERSSGSSMTSSRSEPSSADSSPSLELSRGAGAHHINAAAQAAAAAAAKRGQRLGTLNEAIIGEEDLGAAGLAF